MPIRITRYTPAIQPGVYQATVTSVEERTSAADGSQYRRWEFTLDDGRTVSATSSMQTSPRSKAGKWIAALIGKVPDSDTDVEVVGKRATISVILNDEGFERIDGVMPAMSGARKAANQHAIQEGDDLPF